MVINNVMFNVELSDVINELVAQLRANNINYIQKTKETSTHIQVCCPYHNGGMEQHPSAGIRKSDGKFHCFACNQVHDLAEVISHCFGHTNDYLGKFGWRWLLKNFASMEVEVRKDVKLDLSRSTVSSIRDRDRSDSGMCKPDPTSAISRCNARSDIPYVSEEELDTYRYYHNYMYERGLSDDIISLFDVGYDRATNSLTFPVRDIDGNCLFVARRKVDYKYFNYPKDVEKPLYGLYELKISGWFEQEHISDILVCESMLDALSAWVYGKPAVALNGVENDLQVAQLKELPCRKIILATDNDEAGFKARNRLKEKLKNKIVTQYRFPIGKKDLNELSKEEFDALKEVF